MSEADTVALVKDILDHVFGFDKYTEVAGEHEIRGAYRDDEAAEAARKLSRAVNKKASTKRRRKSDKRNDAADSVAIVESKVSPPAADQPATSPVPSEGN